MKVIECIGLPGSGKSTLTPIVKRTLQERGIPVFDAVDIVLASHSLPARRMFLRLMNLLPASLRRVGLKGLTKIFGIKKKYLTKFKSEYPEIVSYVRHHIEKQSIPEAHKLMMTRWFLNLGSYYVISQESHEAVVILEEGFVHKAVAFFVTAEEPRSDSAAVEKYLDLIPVPDILFKIAVDVETCRQRLKGRGLPRRLRGKSEEEILNYLYRAESVLEQAVQSMTRRGCMVAILDNRSKGVAENMGAQLVSALREIDGQIAESRIHVN